MIEPEPIAPQLEVEEQSLDGRRHVIALTGELDMGTIDRLGSAVGRAVEAEATVVVIDLVGLTFIDSSGLAALLAALRQLERAGGRLLLACANPTVLRLFEITRTDTTFDISPTRERALERSRLAAMDGGDASGR